MGKVYVIGALVGIGLAALTYLAILFKVFTFKRRKKD